MSDTPKHGLKDGGTRETFATGAVRETRNKGRGRFDLVPWYTIIRLAKHYEAGASKYAARNWEKGLPLSSLFDSAMSHLIQFIIGDREEDHLAAAFWNIGGLIWTEEQIRLGKLPIELNDLPEVKIASLAQAVAAIDRARTKSPEQLIQESGAKGVCSAAQRDPLDEGYPEDVKAIIREKLGSWEDHAPYTDWADAYMKDPQLFDNLQFSIVEHSERVYPVDSVLLGKLFKPVLDEADIETAVPLKDATPEQLERLGEEDYDS